MSLKFGILGLGQFGSNIADYAITKGFKAVVANTASVDLSRNKYIKEENKINLGGEGAGRERSVGAEAIISGAEIISEKCLKEFRGCDAIIVAAAGGGGTGSGGLSIGIELLMDSFDNVCAIIGLPENSESPKAKMNTLECFQELSSIENIGAVFIVDNQKIRDLNKDIPRNELYQLGNKEIIDYICELNDVTVRSSYVSNFDTKDLMGIIQERGYSIISKVEGEISGGDNKFKIAKIIRESWKSNCQASFSSGQIVKAAIISEIDPSSSTFIDPNIIFQEVGIPYDFNEVCFTPQQNLNNESIKNFKFYTILSGLAFPSERLNEMADCVKSMEEKLISNFNTSQTQTFDAEAWSNKFKKNKKKTKNDRKDSVLEKIKKYASK